nr:superoxide dismutase [Cu-Zn] SodC [uncultured Pseudomonas sp.]
MNKWIAAAVAGCASMSLHAASLEVSLQSVSAEGQGSSVGNVEIDKTPYGLVFTPHLQGLEPGIHGFHLHAKGNCAPAEKDGKTIAAGAAGGHWDPQNTGKHDMPWGDGHLGDLPALLVDAEGNANQPVLAPRLKSLDDLKGLAIMVHQGGDNHADHPAPLGGGGARVACGVIE